MQRLRAQVAGFIRRLPGRQLPIYAEISADSSAVIVYTASVVKS
jgi:hypothetical protein